MLPCMVKYQCSSKMLLTSIRRFAIAVDPLEIKMAQKKKEVSHSHQVEEIFPHHETKYSTTDDFKGSVRGNRIRGAENAEDGEVPTAWQKRFLVWTRLYPSIYSIPPYVHHGTMNRMHDRVRALVIITATTLIMGIYFAGELKMDHAVKRDRGTGTITRM